MAYATLAEFKARIGTNVSPPGLWEQLTDRVNGTTANDAVGQAVLAEAEAVVNGYLANRYATPVAAAAGGVLADLLRTVTLDVAAYRLRMTSRFAAQVTREEEEAYRATQQMLQRISTGAMALPDAPASALGSGRVVVGGEPRILTGMEGT